MVPHRKAEQTRKNELREGPGELGRARIDRFNLVAEMSMRWKVGIFDLRLSEHVSLFLSVCAAVCLEDWISLSVPRAIGARRGPNARIKSVDVASYES